jgi:hypothetical protein
MWPELCVFIFGAFFGAVTLKGVQAWRSLSKLGRDPFTPEEIRQMDRNGERQG